MTSEHVSPNEDSGRDARAAVNAPTSRRRAWLALVILVPAPTIGTMCGLLAPDGAAFGDVVYAIAKVWLFTLPVIWLLLVERRPISWSKPAHGGFGVGAIIGLAMLLAIVGGYLILGRHVIDPQTARDAAARTGLDDPTRYILFAAYLTFINALLEEYVWRWFVFEKCEVGLAGRQVGAILLAALFFTIHHTVALSIQFAWPAVVLGTIGVFGAGAVWSWLYQRYRSVWVPFVSHIFADIGVFIAGWLIIFSG